MAELVVGIDTSEKLPEGYIRLEYLRSVNGAQWIVDTTLTTMNTGSYEIAVSDLTQLCRFVGFCQGAETTTGDGYYTQCCVATANSVSDRTNTYFPINYYDNGWNDDSTNKVNIIQKNVLRYEFKQGDQKLYVNGVLNKTATQSNIPSGSYPFRLFRAGGSVYTITFNGSSSIHYCKVFDANGDLIRHYIPAKRNSDNVYGMYELKTKRFLINKGSGTFTAGPEYTPNVQYVRVPALVVGKTQQRKYQLLDRVKDDSNNEIGTISGFFTKKVEGHNLPDTYQELEYIESNGTQYIDTGLKFATSDTRLDYYVKCSVENKSTETNFMSNMGFNLGFGNSGQFLTYSAPYIADQEEKMISWYTLPSGTTTVEATGYYSSASFYNNYTTNVYDYMTYTPQNDTYNITLFKHPLPNLSARNYSGKIYAVKLTIDGELKRDFVPAKRDSDGVLGMYDMVSGTFFINSGSDTFIAGPYVIPDNMEYAVVCLDSTNRATGQSLFNNYTTKMVGIPTLSLTDNTDTIYSLSQTATENTNAILATATSTGGTSAVANYVRSKSFVIDGNTYYGQIPNAIELLDIYTNRSTINSLDSSGNINNSYSCHSSTQIICGGSGSTVGRYSHVFMLPWGGLNGNWWDNTVTTLNSASIYTIPVLEIPNIIE